MSGVNIQLEISKKAEELIRRFGNSPELGQRVALAMDQENQISVDLIKAKLSGPVLNRVTGRLRDSIGRTMAVISGSSSRMEVHSTVGSGVGQGAEAVRYAAIHEFGGRIQITPQVRRIYIVEGRFSNEQKFKKHIRKYAGDNTSRRFAYIKPYTIVMPRRSYLRSTLNTSERQLKYSKRISSNVVRFLGGNN